MFETQIELDISESCQYTKSDKQKMNINIFILARFDVQSINSCIYASYRQINFNLTLQGKSSKPVYSVVILYMC